MPVWTMLSGFGAQILPHLPEQVNLALALVSEAGRFETVGAHGLPLPGWRPGADVPPGWMEALHALPPGGAGVLSEEGEALTVVGLRQPEGWLLVAFPQEPAATATEREELQEALLQSELRYRTFLEQSPLGVLHLDREGVVTMENHAFRQIVGEEAVDAWIGLNVRDVPGLDEGLRQRLLGLLAGEEVVRGIPWSFVRRADGERRHLVLHGSPIKSPEGQVAGAVVMVEDVTEARRQQAALSLHERYDRAEADLRAAALAHPDELPFLRAAAAIVGRAARAHRVHVLVDHPLDGRHVSRAVWGEGPIDPEPLLIDNAVLTRWRDAGPVHAADDGPARELLELTGAVEAGWLPFREAGRHAGFVVVERLDRTEERWSDDERRCLERLLEAFETLWAWVQTESRYRLTLATIDDALFQFTYDAGGARQYVFLTPQVEALTGHAPSVWLARGPDVPRWEDDLVHPDDRASLAAHEERLRQGRESRVTYRIRHRDGGIRWLREAGTPLPDAAGHVTVSGILSDVSDQKEAEAMLLRAKEEAEASNRLKTAFIATMSHEVRTPLGAVSGFAELLELELREAGVALPPEVFEFVGVIRERTAHLLVLVNDLFELANLDLGKVTLERSELAIGALLQRLVTEAAARAREKGLDLHLHVAPDLPAIETDARRLEQALRNLLANAIKFTDSGHVDVRAEGDADGVTVVIRDTGVGMSEAHLERLFTPFVQEESWRTRRFEGTGLGLTLTKRLLDRIGGRIEVESTRGEGSTFRVWLPRRLPEA